MESGRWNRVLARGALAASLLIGGAASAASAPAAATPTLSKVQVRLVKSTGATTTWLLTANAADRDGDLLGGRVRIKLGAKGKVLTRRIVAARGLASAGKGGPGITSATLAGKTLRVVFVVNRSSLPLAVRFSVADRHGHATKQVVVVLKKTSFTPPGQTTVTITATDASAAEPSGEGMFTVTRRGSTAAALTVSYTVGGTATPRSDYTALPGSVTIRAGSASAAITVDPVDDAAAEPSESVILTLSARAGYSLGSPSSATVRIADDDGGATSDTTVIIVSTDPNAAEPSDTGTMVVTRSGGSLASSLVVTYRVTGTATPGVDYTALPGTITIPAGASSATITINPIADSITEVTENVIVTLASSPSYTIGTSSVAIVTIANASASVVTISATDSQAAEPSNTGTFTVTRTGSTTTSLTVSYSVSGTATPGIDYTTLPGTITIPAGSSSAMITVTPINDSTPESSETVVVFLSFSTGYSVGSPSSATVSIADDDSGGTVTIAATDPNAAESPLDTGTFTVTRSAASTSSLVVSYAVTGTATAGSDYTGLSGSVTIAANATSATITVTPINDTDAEGNETVAVTLTAGTGYTVGSPSSGTVTIADDESPSPTVSILATDPNAAEPSDPGTFTVTRSASSTSSLVVSYTVAGSATPGADYSTLSGSVTIPANETSATITVTPVNDTDIEGNEAVTLTLAAGAGYTVGSPSTATVTIADDDGTATPTVTIVATDDHCAEPNDSGTFTVTRTDTGAALTVNYQVSGTASNGTDYTTLTGIVIIPAGEASATIVVSVIDDTTAETPPETVTVTLNPQPGYSVGTPGTATIAIIDND